MPLPKSIPPPQLSLPSSFCEHLCSFFLWQFLYFFCLTIWAHGHEGQGGMRKQLRVGSIQGGRGRVNSRHSKLLLLKIKPVCFAGLHCKQTSAQVTSVWRKEPVSDRAIEFLGGRPHPGGCEYNPPTHLGGGEVHIVYRRRDNHVRCVTGQPFRGFCEKLINSMPSM